MANALRHVAPRLQESGYYDLDHFMHTMISQLEGTGLDARPPAMTGGVEVADAGAALHRRGAQNSAETQHQV